MDSLISIYLFIAVIWFFQEYKESDKFLKSLIIGLFWILEVFDIITNKL